MSPKTHECQNSPYGAALPAYRLWHESGNLDSTGAKLAKRAWRSSKFGDENVRLGRHRLMGRSCTTFEWHSKKSKAHHAASVGPA